MHWRRASGISHASTRPELWAGVRCKLARVVVVSWYSPTTPDSGERVRLNRIVREISRRHVVTVLAFEPPRRESGGELSEAQVLHAPTHVDYRVAGPKLGIATVRGRSIWEVSLTSAACRSFVQSKLEDLQPEVIVSSQLPPWPLIPREYYQRTIVDTHNSEGLRLSRTRRHGYVLPWQQVILQQQERAAVRFESAVSRDAAMVWAVSQSEVDYFTQLGARCALVPNGVDMPDATWQPRPGPINAASPAQLLFLGSLSYRANRDALKFFVSEWAAKSIGDPWFLHVVGSGDPGKVQRILSGDPRIAVLGRACDVSAVLLGHDALIIPMRLGGGTRLKALEALAHGMPIVSTRMGMEGVNAVANLHYLPAETGEQFRASLAMLAQEPARVAQMAAAGRDLASGFRWSDIGALANTLIDAVLAGDSEALLRDCSQESWV